MEVKFKKDSKFPIQIILAGGSQWLTITAAKELKEKLEEILKDYE